MSTMSDELESNLEEVEIKKEIEMNMLRERAEKVTPISDEDWKNVNPFNRNLVEEFLLESTHLSAQSQKQYKSALRIFYYWVYESLNDKPLNKIKKKDFMRFQNSLIRRGMSSNGVKMKRSVISSLNKYIINYYEDDEEFETFRNFVEGVQNPTPNKVYNKVALTEDEYELILKTLEEDGQWQILAAVKLLYVSGCRKGELLQLKKEIVNYEPMKDKDGKSTDMYKTHDIRAKGRGEQGEVRGLFFDEDTRKYLVKWLEHRGEDDCPYLFATQWNGKMDKLNDTTPNYWFSEIISDIVGRRINVHLTRSTRATHALNSGTDIKKVAKLLSHKSSETTSKFYDLRDDNDDLSDMF